MTNPTPQATANGARLVRLLAELGMSDARLSHQGFADRLGQLKSGNAERRGVSEEDVDVALREVRLALLVAVADAVPRDEAGDREDEPTNGGSADGCGEPAQPVPEHVPFSRASR